MSSFGAPKLDQFNNKNRLHFSIGGVLKNFCFETMPFFFIWIFFFFSLSVSQNFKIPKMSLEKRKFGGKSQILPKSWKINKCWFLCQILQQFCSLDPKVPDLWILWLYDFWSKLGYFELKKKKMLKIFF